jgi:hypothetical protein
MTPEQDENLARELVREAQRTVNNWPQWKKDESEREDARFREMGDVARHQR